MSREYRKSKGSGWLYAIINPAWHGYVKFGRTFDLKERLRAYQISSPKRDYVLHYSKHFPDVLAAERRLHTQTAGFPGMGEWCLIHPDDAKRIIDNVGAKLNKSLSMDKK